MINTKNNKNITKIIRFLDPVLMILLLFIIFLILLIYNLTDITTKIRDYSNQQSIINELKILDTDFDNLMSQQANFINYDGVVTKIDQFYSYIEKLNNEQVLEKYSDNLIEPLELLQAQWIKKHEQIEYFKSHNASIVGSLNYIIELTKSIKKKYYDLDKNNIFLLDTAINNLFKIFINIELDETTIQKDSNNLISLKNKYKTHEFDFLYLKYHSTLSDIIRINHIRKEYDNINIKFILESIELALKKEYQTNIDSQQNMSLSIFIITTILFVLLILVYLKSLKTKKELKSFRYAVENSDNSIVMTDKDRRITYVNEAFEKITGYSKKEALGKNPNILKSDQMPKEFYSNMNDILDKGEKWHGEFINIDKNGNIYYETASITPIIEDDKINGYLAIKLNVTDYINEQEKVEFLAYHDSLTLLPNRRSLEKNVNILLNEAKINKTNLAIFFMDLDGFKTINDALGHDIGDLLLQAVTKRFRHILRDTDHIFRIGGDEFAIAIEYSQDKDYIDLIANKLIKTINEPLHIEDHSLHIGLSIGVARYPQDGEDLMTLLKHADTAMYKAKHDGKNRYYYYNSELSTTVHTRLNIEQSLLSALDNNELYVVYQPKYDVKTKTIFSIEALLRWSNVKLGEIEPNKFIHIAEEAGLINKIGLFVFRQACMDFKILQKKLKTIKLITINVSTIQLKDTKFTNKLLDITKELDINPINIGLEITETHIMKNINNIHDTLFKLRKAGFKILIDDFGTGYSSMSYIQKLPIDILKIDKSFIDDIKLDNDNTIIKAIVSISKSFGYTTVAEGIEDKIQEDILVGLDVDYGQGFYFCKPKRIDDLMDIL
ncbi:MAG: EAL domain-containing protein [Arcobacteraceae bacterium]|nr:EAL domain-containing protein [Arcobacteraceae bacterium]